MAVIASDIIIRKPIAPWLLLQSNEKAKYGSKPECLTYERSDRARALTRTSCRVRLLSNINRVSEMQQVSQGQAKQIAPRYFGSGKSCKYLKLTVTLACMLKASLAFKTDRRKGKTQSFNVMIMAIPGMAISLNRGS